MSAYRGISRLNVGDVGSVMCRLATPLQHSFGDRSGHHGLAMISSADHPGADIQRSG